MMNQPMANWNAPTYNYGQVTATNMPQTTQQQMSNQPSTVGMPSLSDVQRQSPLPSLPAKIITKVEDIKASDVPMDGTISIFLMNDLSSVILRQLNGRLDMEELRFVRDVSSPQPDQNDILPVIMQRLDDIEKAVKKNSYRPRYNKNYKKGNNKNA